MQTPRTKAPSRQELLQHYACGAVQFSGDDNASYEWHLVLDHVVEPQAASLRERFEAVARSLRDLLVPRWLKPGATYDRDNPKHVYYLSMEFLLCCRCCQALVNVFSPSTFSAVSHDPNWSGGFRWRWDPSVANDLLSVQAHTPVTRCSLRLATRAGRPVGGDPISPTAFLKGPEVQRAASTRTKIERGRSTAIPLTPL